MLSVAFDVHGTLDSDPDGVLQTILLSMMSAGHMIHIISGPPKEQIKKELDEIGIDYSDIEITSVVDYLTAIGVTMTQDEKGHWWCYDSIWWASKGMICTELDIDIIFDDSIRYADHMPKGTRFILW